MQECKWEMLLEQLTYQSLAQLLVEGWGDNRKKFFESCEGRYVLPSLNIKYQAWRHTKHKYQRHVCLDSELLIRSFLIYTYCSTAHSRNSICLWPQCEIPTIYNFASRLNLRGCAVNRSVPSQAHWEYWDWIKSHRFF